MSGITTMLLAREIKFSFTHVDGFSGSESSFLKENLGWCTVVYTAGNIKRLWKSFEIRNLISMSIRAGWVVVDPLRKRDAQRIAHRKSKEGEKSERSHGSS